MNTALTVKEAKVLYGTSRLHNGRDFKKIIVIKDNMMEYVVKSRWSGKESIQEDMEKLETADMLFDGGF